MFVGAYDACVLGFAFDAVDVGDDFERFFDLRMRALLVQLATRVRQTSSALASTRLRDRVVIGVLVDDEPTL
jgi:hypothetical protein